MSTNTLPAALAEIVDDFQALTEPDRLQLLLDFSRGLPALPERLLDHPELLEQVVECQSPLFLTIEQEKTPDGVALPFVLQGTAGSAHHPRLRGRFARGPGRVDCRGDPGCSRRHAGVAGPHPGNHTTAHARHDGHAGADQAQSRRSGPFVVLIRDTPEWPRNRLRRGRRPQPYWLRPAFLSRCTPMLMILRRPALALKHPRSSGIDPGAGLQDFDGGR